MNALRTYTRSISISYREGCLDWVRCDSQLVSVWFLLMFFSNKNAHFRFPLFRIVLAVIIKRLSSHVYQTRIDFGSQIIPKLHYQTLWCHQCGLSDTKKTNIWFGYRFRDRTTVWPQDVLISMFSRWRFEAWNDEEKRFVYSFPLQKCVIWIQYLVAHGRKGGAKEEAAPNWPNVGMWDDIFISFAVCNNNTFKSLNAFTEKRSNPIPV